MQYTESMRIKGEMAFNMLSDRAKKVCLEQRSMTIYAYDTPAGTRYSFNGNMGLRENMTFEQLEGFLEWVDLVDISQHMDSAIRQSVHDDCAPCSVQEFLDEYSRRHYEKYREPFKYGNVQPVITLGRM